MKYLLAFLFPPAAFIDIGRPGLLPNLLTCLGWAPGVIHALCAIMNDEADERVTRIINALKPPAPPQPPQWAPKLPGLGTTMKTLPPAPESFKIPTPAKLDGKSYKLTSGNLEAASEKDDED